MPSRIAAAVLVALAAAGCRSAPPPASPGRAETFAGGLSAQRVGTREGSSVIGESGGCLMGYISSPTPGDGGDEAHAATAEHSRAVELFDRAYAAEDLAEALRLLEEMLRIDSLHAGAWNNRGLLLMCRGDEEEARRSFEAAIARDPGHRAARHNVDRLVSGSR